MKTKHGMPGAGPAKAALPVAVLLLAAACAAPVAPGAAALHHEEKQAIAQGDVEAAMRLLSDDVVYIAGPNCPPARPCIGKAQVREGFMAWASEQRLRVTPLDGEAGGAQDNPARVRVSATWRGIERYGAQRVTGTDVITARDGRITRLVFEPDTSDPQTAAVLRAMREAQQANAR